MVSQLELALLLLKKPEVKTQDETFIWQHKNPAEKSTGKTQILSANA